VEKFSGVDYFLAGSNMYGLCGNSGVFLKKIMPHCQGTYKMMSSGKV
jgi:hypothetical protein